MNKKRRRPTAATIERSNPLRGTLQKSAPIVTQNHQGLQAVSCLWWVALMLTAAGLGFWALEWLYRTAPALTVFLLFSLLALLAGRGLTQGGDR